MLHSKGMNENEKYKNKAVVTIDDVTGTEYPEARFYIKRNLDNLSKLMRAILLHGAVDFCNKNEELALGKHYLLIPTCQSINNTS